MPDSDGEQDEQQSLSTVRSCESPHRHAAQSTKSKGRGLASQYRSRQNELGTVDNMGRGMTNHLGLGSQEKKVISKLSIDCSSGLTKLKIPNGVRQPVFDINYDGTDVHRAEMSVALDTDSDSSLSFHESLDWDPPPEDTRNAVSHNSSKATGSDKYVYATSPKSIDLGEISDSVYYRTGRELRKRNPIQVHPYKLEIEKYRQALKARGVRPVNIVIETQPDGGSVSSSDAEVGSRSQSLERSSPLPNARKEGNRPRGQLQRLSESTSPRFRPPPISTTGWIDDDEDELPDLETLLQNPHHHTVKQGHKRRKVTAENWRLGSGGGLISRQRNENDAARILSPVTNVFDIPPSPETSPTSWLETAVRSNDARFRVPPGFSAAALPTPVNSSGSRGQLRKRPTTVIQVDDDSDSEPAFSPRRPRPQTVVLSDDDEDGNNSDDSEGSRQSNLERIRRKIKGVLPASWLKLDQQAQQKSRPQEWRHHDRDHVGGEANRGVAHKRVRSGTLSHPPPPTMDAPIPTFDDDLDSSEVERGQTLQSPSPPRKRQRLFDRENQFRFVRNDDDPGTAMEDDMIDRMFAPSSSTRKPEKTAGKRQMRLKDAFSRQQQRQPNLAKENQTQNFVHSSTAKPRERTSKSHRHSVSAKLKRRTAPKLSIIDAISPTQTQAAVPQFLRIAARQTEKHPDRGRHSPTKKYIRLATLQDTEDASSVLQIWREGSIQPRQRGQCPDKTTRPALEEVSANQQQRLPSPRPIHKIQRKNSKSFGKVVKHVQTNLLQHITRKDGPEHMPYIQGKDHQQRSSTATAIPRSRMYHRQFRDAQLEASENDFEWTDRQAAFQSHLRKAGNNSDVSTTERLSAITLGFDGSVQAQDSRSKSSRRDHQTSVQPVRRLRRKMRPHRLDVETKEYRQPESTVLPSPIDPQIFEILDSDEQILTGLGPYGMRYSADFDIRPLEPGTYFHESSFIGSGDFERALLMRHRDLDIDVGSHRTILCDTNCTWSTCDENMGKEMRKIFQWMEDVLRSSSWNTDSQPLLDSLAKLAPTLQEVIVLNSKWLSFIDPIDRSAFVTKIRQHLASLFESTLDKLPSLSMTELGLKAARELLRFLTRQLSLAAQLLAILRQNSGCLDMVSEAQQLALIISRAIVYQLTQGGFSNIGRFLEDNRRHLIREAGIRSDQVEVEATLVVYHALNTNDLPGTSFWNVLNKELFSRAKETHDVLQFEKMWQALFTVLPTLEVDTAGVFRPRLRLRHSSDNWEPVKATMSRVFELYHITPSQSSPIVNEYIRTLLSRCYVLVSTWAWRRCETIISTIFDFFAGNGLAPLRKETTNGSPNFLKNLHLRPSLELSPEDKAFHVFLKLVALGLLQMREIYAHKKIRSIAWRWIPNHGRTHRKDEELRQEDLEALRNHHDLLCVLYWASPPGFRPRLDLIQNLVDHGSSHREACRLSVRAWSNLVKFQVSTNEPETNLQPFASWFKDMLGQSLDLYRTARTEAEGHFESANKYGERLISSQLLERTISRNQQQVLATIADAMNGMRGAMSQANSTEQAIALLQNSDVAQVFGLFDSKKARVSAVMIEALDVYQTFINLLDRKQQPESQKSSEESQDYGDWPDFDESPVKQIRPKPSIHFVIDPLAEFMSNAFGAEASPEEGLLVKIVEAWVKVARYQVRQGVSDWSSFLDPYSRHSWSQLRETEQKRKFTSFLYSLVINCDAQAFSDNRQTVISAWLVSLVDRESMLKFQHEFTSAMLSVNLDDPLLFNMPFTKPTRSPRHTVSLTELRQRRLVTISTVLANMQRSFYETIANSPAKVNQIRREYSEYLKQLMSAMKANYQELGDGDTARGSYVEFVQAVVESLQQYTTDVCTVDKFFTDSAAFPLPAKDPTYVVGRLKSYTAKLSEPRTVKQLSVFIQNVSERAVGDNQQSYLVDQLKAAIGSQRESGRASRLTLCAVLAQTIFPAYICLALRTTSGWIIAEPILEVCKAIFDDALYRFSISHVHAVQTVLQSINTVLYALQQSMDLLIVHSGLFELPHVLRTLGLMFNAVTSSLDCLDYILRATGEGKQAAQLVRWFKSFSVFALEIIMGQEDAQAPSFEEDIRAPKLLYPEIREFCERELNQELASRWTRVGETYYLLRGNSRRELRVELGSMEEEQSRLIFAIEEMHMVLDRVPSLNTRAEISPSRIESLE